MTTVALAEAAEINPRLPQKPADGDLVSFLPMAELGIDGRTTAGMDRPFAELAKGYTPFLDGDLLVAKITPCFQNNKIGQASLARPVGVGSTEFHVVRPRPGVSDPRYLMHFLRQERVRADGERRMTGSGGQRRVPAQFLQDLEVPLPPLAEQRRIAAILDQVERLRAARRRVTVLTSSFEQEYLKTVIEQEPTGSIPFGDVVASMRNGSSPVTGGTVHSSVLTLSAITRGAFDASARKTGSFREVPSTSARVRAGDFLICRGNGNADLVGAGVVVDTDHADLVFPDTVIAVTVQSDVIDPGFLAAAWRLPGTRVQIRSSARTTSGIHKVNQQSLAQVAIPLPSLDRQREFVRRRDAVSDLQRRHSAARQREDDLYQTCVWRAFSGQL